MPVFCHRNMQATSRFYHPLLFGGLLFSTVNLDGFKPNLETHLLPLLSMKPEDTSLESNSKEKNSALSSKAHHHRLLMQVAVVFASFYFNVKNCHRFEVWTYYDCQRIVNHAYPVKRYWFQFQTLIPKTKKKKPTWRYSFNWSWLSYKKHFYLSDYHSSLVVVVLY